MRQRLADRLCDAQQKPDAILETAAVVVFAVVAQWGIELVQQIAVGRMNLHELETCRKGAPCGLLEIGHDLIQFAVGQSARHRIAASKGTSVDETGVQPPCFFESGPRRRAMAQRYSLCVRHEPIACRGQRPAPS